MSDTMEPEDAENVLVLTDGDALAVCLDAITAPVRFLAVSYTRPAGEFVTRLGELESPPEETVIIEARQGGPSSAPEETTVRAESPSNLTGLGVRSNEFLTRWSGDDVPVVVYFDSITSLLQYADTNQAYRFMHVFTSRVSHADGVGYYHLVSGAHDDSTVATFKQLFDTVLTHDPDTDEYRVQRR